MNSSRRRTLKWLGVSVVSLGAVSSSVALVSQTAWLIPKPQGKKQTLITDPTSEQFVYVDGYIVKADQR